MSRTVILRNGKELTVSLEDGDLKTLGRGMNEAEGEGFLSLRDRQGKLVLVAIAEIAAIV